MKPCMLFFTKTLPRIRTGSSSLLPRGGARGSRSPSRGGRTRLPKFKFSAKFPIGLHVILQIQIRKFENDSYIM